MGPVSDKRFLTWLHTLPCAVEGHDCSGPITAHHVRRYGERRDDRQALPLCCGHHLRDWGPDAIHRIGRRQFEERLGIDIEGLILRLNAAWQNVKRAA